MRPALVLASLAAALACGAARAETSNVSASGFLVTHRVEVDAAPRAVYESLARVDGWWNAEHTYSGKSANLVLEPRAGGCFCERWDGNSVEHAHVIYAHRDKALRMEGALGPLQETAVRGILTFSLAPSDARTALTVTYRVRGAEAGLEKLAPAVDRVIGDQARRLAAFATVR